MLEGLKKIGENKVLKFLGNLIYTLIFIIAIFMLIVVVLQRVSNNSIGLGDYRIFTVATGSMVPEYEVGDILISGKIEAGDIKIGDDIVYKGKEGSFKDRFVTHRVIYVSNGDGTYRYVTKGIANTAEDPEITYDQVYGKIIYKVGFLFKRIK